jgi:hypothetical protein
MKISAGTDNRPRIFWNMLLHDAQNMMTTERQGQDERVLLC